MTTAKDTYLDGLARWRADRDDFFASHYASPLADEVMAEFAGLRYFPPDFELVFEVDLESAPSSVDIESSTGTSMDYPGAGGVTVSFPVGAVTMSVLNGEDDDLFIPFRDATSGVSTYRGGRYVGVERGPEDRFTVDFNKAINPYCAYDPEFSCPLPPASNCLEFPIAAGELDYR